MDLGKNKIWGLLTLFFCVLLSSCSPSLPRDARTTDRKPQIYPDYTDIDIPVNIAPMNFHVEEKGDAYMLAVKSGEREIVKDDSKGDFLFSQKEWREMLKDADGRSIEYTLYAQNKGRWTRYKTFTQRIQPDSIDKYLTYRLIEPLYYINGAMGIFQYDNETAEQTAIYDYRSEYKHNNMKETRCTNCHATQPSNPKNRCFYIRGAKNGIVLTYNGKTEVIKTKCGDMKFSTAYSVWHPTLPILACMSEKVRQNFSSCSKERIYQFDMEADIFIYDAEKNEVRNGIRSKDKLEALFCWSPDGKYLYYGSSDTAVTGSDVMEKIRYDLFRAEFDADSMKFKNSELVFCATKKDSSAASPIITPDNKYMIFRMAKYGMYMQTNKSADVFCMDLQTKNYWALDSINSPQSESFQSLSSNGRWLMTESKREDGNYNRVFYAYFDEKGIAHKPFQMPHEDPQYDRGHLKSYNCSAFTTLPSETSNADMLRFLRDAEVKTASFASPIDTSSADAASGASNVDAQTGASRVDAQTGASRIDAQSGAKK